MARKLIRAMILMEQIPFEDLSQHVGENVWFSAAVDCIPIHGPVVVGLLGKAPDEKLVLFPPNLLPILVADLHQNTFWRLANDPSLLFERP